MFSIVLKTSDFDTHPKIRVDYAKTELFTGTSIKANTHLGSLTNVKPPNSALCRACEVVEILATKTFTIVRKITDLDTNPNSRWIR